MSTPRYVLHPGYEGSRYHSLAQLEARIPNKNKYIYDIDGEGIDGRPFTSESHWPEGSIHVYPPRYCKHCKRYNDE